MTIHVTDVAIVGGGMVGGALALGLAQQGFTVTVLEKAAPPAFDPASAPGCADLGDQRGFGRPAEESRRLGCHTGDARPCISPSGDLGVGERARRLRRRGAQAAGAGLYGREQGSAMGPVASAGGA